MTETQVAEVGATETEVPDKLKFDVIVVGAGPAGLAAGTVCARAGLDTIIIERGRKPGTKNVMGGVLYTRPTAEVWPEFWKDAPLERCVIEQNAWIMTEDSAIKLGYRSAKFAEDVPNAFTVLRVKVDQYFAQQAEAAGALIISETKVDEVLREDGRVVGVRTGRPQGEVYAPVVILAEGVNPILARELGMHEDLDPSSAALTVKELLRLDPEVIEERFGLDEGEGATIEMYGAPTMGMLGTAFIYTNESSLSLAVGVLLSEFAEVPDTPHDLLQQLKQHPAVAPLVEGAEPAEYMAHLIPEGGYDKMPALFGHGVMIVGDAAQLVNGIHREGSNHAILSGKAAAETAIEAHHKGDFSERTLGHYRQRLEEATPTIADLRKYRKATKFMERHPILKVYPPLAAYAFEEMLTVDDKTKRQKQWEIIKEALRRRKPWAMAWDAIEGGLSFI